MNVRICKYVYEFIILEWYLQERNDVAESKGFEHIKKG